MSNSKKLDSINQKIEKLTQQKKDMENKMIESIAKQISGVLVKKRIANINISELMKKIEVVIDNISNSKQKNGNN